MRHLARHHRELVVRILVGSALRLVVILCLVLSTLSLNPAPVSAGSLKASWNANTEPDLAGYKIYYGRSSRNYTTTINVGKVTEYTVDQLTEGVVYYFAVTAYDNAGNESGYSQEVSAQVQVVDRTPPSVISVQISDRNTVEIVFSETVSISSAQDKSNYVIDNGITITSATLQPDNRTVKLVTSSHEFDKTYRLTIQKIADRATVPNVMTQAVSFNYLLASVDRTPPAVASFRAVNPQTLSVVFSEAVSLATAQNSSNYSINNNVTVTGAKLESDAKTVTLTTSAHAIGVNYTLTIRGIADRAPVPNVMTQAASFNYVFSSVDRTPPTIVSFRAVTQQTLEVVFDEAVSSTTAQNSANYTITPGITIQSAKLQQDTRTVVLTTSLHAVDVNYTLTIRSIADRASTPNIMSQPAAFNYSFHAVDNTPPAVSNVRSVNATTVEVLFSEPVTAASAQNKANYSINKGITISSATLQADLRSVNLATSAHTDGEAYFLTVNNIADRAAPSNLMTQAATFTYIYQTEDRQPPEVNAVKLTDLTHLLIVFNERVTSVSAENVSNYRISDNIKVDEARLASNGLEVTLTTSPHQYNKDYNISIVNIKDRSPAANAIAANTMFTYYLANNPHNNYFGVEDLQPLRYILDSVRVGETYYIDRPYVVTQIPNSKRGLLWIKTASNDRSDISEQFLAFTLTYEANIYVAYDSRAIQPPNWLKNHFTRTNESIAVSESSGKLNLWKMWSAPGRVIFGGNMASGVQAPAGSANTSLSMYVVLIENVQAPKFTDSQTPQRFMLYQNYPNPFSLSGALSGMGYTKIDYYLQEQHYVVLTVHNALGQMVRKLYSGLLPAGNHSLAWDGRDDKGEPLPSGTYLCTLEVREEVTKGDITMSASLSRQTKVITLLK
ncbi:MAG: fibronectin type III domain-containing protein [candidate division KSB1 bacterium]|nr:fibronectin type III domain-containing protein [candidate division KSB1 bacterium]MDZ7300868.1 fibronectin type III domain-containing protein [candidate division KSB1 bacterium]MDZ7309862.1 fibronectin type III domain-containing protein [candidate division KSB1 bacterium]